MVRPLDPYSSFLPFRLSFFSWPPSSTAFSRPALLPRLPPMRGTSIASCRDARIIPKRRSPRSKKSRRCWPVSWKRPFWSMMPKHVHWPHVSWRWMAMPSLPKRSPVCVQSSWSYGDSSVVRKRPVARRTSWNASSMNGEITRRMPEFRLDIRIIQRLGWRS